MFPSKHPFAIYLQIIVVAVVIIGTLIATSNPLALLGLYFLPQIPIVAPDESDESEETGKIGFTADVN